MLESRPIVRTSLIGTAAFAAVFFAAMAGSAFMITGGFGNWDRFAHASTVSQDLPVVRVSWAPSPQQARAAYNAPPYVADEADWQDASLEPDLYTEQDLEGASNGEVTRVSARAPDEAQIMQDFANDYAALYQTDARGSYGSIDEASVRVGKKEAVEAGAY